MRLAPHKLTVIDTEQGVKNLHTYLTDKELISYDCETTGLTKQDQVIGFSVCASIDEAFYVILHKWTVPGLVTMPYAKTARDLVASLRGKSLIMHNGVFDCSMAAAYFKVRLIDSLHTDTLILAHLINENRKLGLKELAKSMFGDDSTTEAAEMKASVLANGGTLTKKKYEMYKADSYLMGKYGAKDALLTFALFLTMVPELYDQKLDKFFYEDESMPLLRGPTYEMNTVGLQVNTEGMASLKKTLETECIEAKAFILHEIAPYIKTRYPGTSKKNVFNISSSQQMAWLLFGQLKAEFGTLTKGGKALCKSLGMKPPYTAAAKRDFIQTITDMKERQNGHLVSAGVGQTPTPIGATPLKIKDPWAYIACDKKTLQKLSNRYDWIGALLDYQRKTKLLKTYIQGITTRAAYGVILPSFLQHGTPSGRYASRNPNFQNLPRDDKRIKECITARPGRAYVGADYSQLEPRVFSSFSKDDRLQAVFNNTTGNGITTVDFYSTIGMEVYEKYDCTPEKDGSPNAFGIKYKALRDKSKTIALAVTYGATAYQLAATTGKSVDETQEDIDRYFERFASVKKFMLESHAQVKARGAVYNQFGRCRRMPEAMRIEKLYGKKDHADYPYEVRSLLNLAVNFRVQSTAASIVNRAAIRFYNDIKQLGIKAPIILQVHDSLIVECLEADAERVSALLQNAMENTAQLDGVRLEAIPKIGYNLAQV